MQPDAGDAALAIEHASDATALLDRVLHTTIPRVMKKHWTLAAVIVGVALVWLVLTWGGPEQVGIEPEPAPPTASAPAGRAAPPVQPAPSPSTREPEPQPPAPPSADPATQAQREEPAPNPRSALPAPDRSGPVDELKQAFASEPRASASVSVESKIASQFKRPEVHTDLVKSILCRTSVCRIETRWSPENAEGFMSALMHLVTEPADPGGFDPQLGISPEGEPGPSGSRAIDVYVKRTAAPPAADSERQNQ